MGNQTSPTVKATAAVDGMVAAVVEVAAAAEVDAEANGETLA